MNFEKLNDNNVINIFTFKPYNFRKNIIKREELEKNYKEIEELLNYKFKKIISPNQTHTNIVKIINKENINDDLNEVDGNITNLKGVAFKTVTAD